jgi:hypothetical protein
MTSSLAWELQVPGGLAAADPGVEGDLGHAVRNLIKVRPEL